MSIENSDILEIGNHIMNMMDEDQFDYLDCILYIYCNLGLPSGFMKNYHGANVSFLLFENGIHNVMYPPHPTFEINIFGKHYAIRNGKYELISTFL